MPVKQPFAIALMGLIQEQDSPVHVSHELISSTAITSKSSSLCLVGLYNVLWRALVCFEIALCHAAL